MRYAGSDKCRSIFSRKNQQFLQTLFRSTNAFPLISLQRRFQQCRRNIIRVTDIRAKEQKDEEYCEIMRTCGNIRIIEPFSIETMKRTLDILSHLSHHLRSSLFLPLCPCVSLYKDEFYLSSHLIRSLSPFTYLHVTGIHEQSRADSGGEIRTRKVELRCIAS